MHGLPNGELPPMRIVMTCIYGGSELKDGGIWAQATSDDVVDRIADRLEDFIESDGPKKIGTVIAAALELRNASKSVDSD